jgi:hypothetical protein
MPSDPTSMKMFLPIQVQQGGLVNLPGLAPEPAGGTVLFPPGTYPIMASGDQTATLMPLADPLPPSPVPLPPEVANVALPEDALVQGLPQLELPVPEPPELPELPLPPGASVPGAQPLGDPLPTSVSFEQRPWPPMLEGYTSPNYNLPSLLPPTYPEQAGLPPMPEAAQPLSLMPSEPLPAALPSPSPEVSGPASEVVPLLPVPAGLSSPVLPELALEPAEPLPPVVRGEPVSPAVQSGWDALAETLVGRDDHEEKAASFADSRSRLRAPVPEQATGQVLWEKYFGG